MTTPSTHTEACKYVFTGAELVDISKEQARLFNEKISVEEQFASLKADHKFKTMTLDAAISSCTMRVSSGFEMRQVKCLVLKFRPDGDSALVVRIDNGRVLRKRRLEDQEKQLKLSTEENPFVFESDFFEDSTSDVVEMVADHVPLTAKEAEELRESGITLKPLRPLIEDSAVERRGRKGGKDAASGN